MTGSNVLCKNGEDQKIVSEFASDGFSRVAALPTMVVALRDSDSRIQTAAADILYKVFRTGFGRDAAPGAIPAADARAFLETVLVLPRPQSRQCIPAVVHAIMLTRQGPELYRTLDKPEHQWLGTVGYRHLMTYGRLDAFEKVRQLSRDQNTALVLAALDNPGNMPEWTEAERAEVCPWAEEFLADQRPAVAAKAASVMTHCGGPYLDALLANVEHLLKDQKLTRAGLVPLRDVCLPGTRTKPGGATGPQCDRTRKLLEAMVKTAPVEAALKGSALEALAYQWPDRETLQLIRQYESAKDTVLSDIAKQTALRLERRTALDAPVSPPSASSPPGRKGSVGSPSVRVPR